MTIQQYSDILEAAAGTNGYLFGYAYEVNQNKQYTFPLIRAYPFNWNETRASHFTIQQTFFIYVKNKVRTTGWDEGLVIWDDFKSALSGNVEVLETVDMRLYDYGEAIEQVTVLEVVANVKIWC